MLIAGWILVRRRKNICFKQGIYGKSISEYMVLRTQMSTIDSRAIWTAVRQIIRRHQTSIV